MSVPAALREQVEAGPRAFSPRRGSRSFGPAEGAISSGASAALQRLAEQLQAPVVTSPNGKGGDLGPGIRFR